MLGTVTIFVTGVKSLTGLNGIFGNRLTLTAITAALGTSSV
jgi:hypothetical protein